MYASACTQMSSEPSPLPSACTTIPWGHRHSHFQLVQRHGEPICFILYFLCCFHFYKVCKSVSQFQATSINIITDGFQLPRAETTAATAFTRTPSVSHAMWVWSSWQFVFITNVWRFDLFKKKKRKNINQWTHEFLWFVICAQKLSLELYICSY